MARPNANKNYYERTHEQDIKVLIPFFILSLLSIFFGFFARDMFIGLGSDMFIRSLYIHPNNILQVEAEFLTSF
jgi:NADH-ubiquinone oxidoreductase chain 5